jgi:hypothetical protein
VLNLSSDIENINTLLEIKGKNIYWQHKTSRDVI